MKKSAKWLLFTICMVLFLICGLLVLFNYDVLSKSPFQQTTSFFAPAIAKYEKDGNLYVIDSGSFRLVCMEPDGNIRYTIEIDRFDEYIRIIDGAIDNAGNLYIYVIEAEYDALLTKREIIKKYDNSGRFIKDIFSVTYDDVRTNPRLFYQFGSFQCDNGILSFSKTEKETVTLYQYDTYRDELRTSILTGKMPDGSVIENFIVAKLVQKDFNNYAYVLRDGDIYEVKNGQAQLRASYDRSLIYEGGIHPWHIYYDSGDNLVFF